VTEYTADIHVALERAQATVFALSEYGHAYKMKRAFAAIGKEYSPRTSEPKPRDIAEARASAAESGTCSVLDVYELGTSPAPAVAGPLPRKVLRSAFGNETPTLQEIDAGLGEIYARLPRGAATYIVAYENGRPTHYVFAGMSFD
jgi:hypothetical protein